jgi:sulfur-oxidizing protein SoxX
LTPPARGPTLHAGTPEETIDAQSAEHRRGRRGAGLRRPARQRPGRRADWRARLVQDETQKLCSRYRDAPPKAVADAILAREKAAIRYPPDGRFMGDWKNGEKLARSGYGGRFTDDPPRAENGANCYACHRLDKTKVSFGTLGPSLSGYGRQRNYAEAEVKAAYERIYSPQAFLPCTGMPRLGASRFLTIEQIKDVVAYLMSPDSPVNK